MIGFLIDVNGDNTGLVEIGDGNHLKQFYDLIGCRCIDITVRKVGGKPYNIVLDDEGLLVGEPTISAIDGEMHSMLAGNLILFGMADDMDLASIEAADVPNIIGNMYEVFDFDTLKTHPIVMMEY